MRRSRTRRTGNRRAGCSRRFAASCSGVSGSTGTRWQRCATRCCASRPGAHGRRTVAGAGVPPRPRRGVQGAQPRAGAGRPAALGAGCAPAAGLGRRADPAGGGREQLAAAGRGHQPGALVLPLLRARERERSDDPRLAVLAGRGAGARPHLVDPAAGCGPARPADDATGVTAARLREVVTRIIEAGHWHDGDPDILVVLDSGYDLTRLAWLLKDLPVEIMGRLRSDRVMYFPAPARQPGANGRPVRHGAAFKLADERSWPAPAVTAVTGTTRYGTDRVAAWGRLHQRLASRAGWEHHDGELPVIEGTLIRLHVDHLPGNRSPEPLWLWSSRAGTSAAEVTRTWQEFLRRFDIEHTFRFFKQVLGWTRPKLRDPAAADRWTWLILACLTQLWLARGIAEDLRLPWQRPAPPGRLTPARVRRGFRNIRQALPDLASAPKPGKPGPGRPPGSKNRRPATRHDVGKTDKRTEPKKKTRSQEG